MSNVVAFPVKEQTYIVSPDNQMLRFEDINELFMNGDLKFCEMAKFFKKCPSFHKWFVKKHASKFL